MRLIEQIDEMRDLSEWSATAAPEVSGWSVGQHIAHCCITVRSSVAAVTRSRGQSQETELTAMGRLVLSEGRIPRGIGVAPKAVVVDEPPTREQLTKSIDRARSASEQLDSPSENGFFDHPYFGVLNQADTLRFLEIHNEHHLSIVRDILTSVA